MIRKFTGLWKILLAPAAAAIVFPVVPALSQTQPWELTYNQEARYFSWSGTRGFPAAVVPANGSGSQFYAPGTVQLTGVPNENLKFELVARGGYVTSRQSSAGATGSVSTFTDTVAAATWTYLGIAGIQPFLTLNANMPTGQSVLLGNATFARMDPDLVDIATFGEGWNFGPTVGINLPLTSTFILSLGAGYTKRGNYNRENPAVALTETRVDPSDILTFNASLTLREGPWAAALTASFSHENKTLFDGVPSFQLGDRYLVSGTAAYTWSEESVTTVTASWNYVRKNQLLNPPPALLLETFNSNSNIYRIRVEHAFTSGKWSAGPLASYLLRDANTYSPTAFQFVPAKTRWSAGGNLRYSVDDKSLLYMTVERVWITENSAPAAAPFPVPNLSSTGWVVAGGASFRY